MSDSDSFYIPPATFEFLVVSLKMQGDMNLDDRAPTGEEVEPNLPWARHFIDMLGVLQEKTKGNLTLEEKRTLDNSVTELRFRYVQVFDRQKQKAAAQQQVPESTPPPSSETTSA